MERQLEISNLRARQAFSNEFAANRAKRALSEYRSLSTASTFTDAIVHLIVDAAHLIQREKPAEVLDLDLLAPAARRLFEAESKRTELGYLDKTEPPSEAD